MSRGTAWDPWPPLVAPQSKLTIIAVWAFSITVPLHWNYMLGNSVSFKIFLKTHFVRVSLTWNLLCLHCILHCLCCLNYFMLTIVFVLWYIEFNSWPTIVFKWHIYDVLFYFTWHAIVGFGCSDCELFPAMQEVQVWTALSISIMSKPNTIVWWRRRVYVRVCDGVEAQEKMSTVSQAVAQHYF